jgi:hypothetical protein
LESSFLIRSRKGIWAALVLAFVSTSAAIAEAPSKVLAAYLDPYGEGIVTVSDCSIIVTTAERHTDEEKYREMIEVVCAALSQAKTTEGRWQSIKAIYIVNRHGEGRLFEGGDQQCHTLNQIEVPRVSGKHQYIVRHTKTVSANNTQTFGQCHAR